MLLLRLISHNGKLRMQGNGSASGGYVSVTLLVDHGKGYSHTWGKQVERTFEGLSAFWVEQNQQ